MGGFSGRHGGSAGSVVHRICIFSTAFADASAMTKKLSTGPVPATTAPRPMGPICWLWWQGVHHHLAAWSICAFVAAAELSLSIGASQTDVGRTVSVLLPRAAAPCWRQPVRFDGGLAIFLLRGEAKRTEIALHPGYEAFTDPSLSKVG